MDYKDLANLIFTNSKEISYYEEKYPRRDLKEGAIVTRYAPSPTGFMHIGGLYQALIAKKVANQTEGVFFLRIEDTDQKREVKNAVSGIVKSLQEFGIEPDEGMISEEEEKGNSIQTISKKRNLSSLCKIFNRTRKSVSMFLFSRRRRRN